MSEDKENYIKTLRKAIGKTQQQFAEELDCGYSTLQGYEAGRAIPKEIRAKLIALALEHNLGTIAAQIAKIDLPPVAEDASLDDRRQIHLIVDAILDGGDSATKEALRSLLKLCELHIIGRPTRARAHER